MGSVPAERQAYFRSFMVVLDEGLDDGAILETITQWIKRPRARLARARAGRALALRHTWDDWLAWVRDAVRAFHSEEMAVYREAGGKPAIWSPLDANGFPPRRPARRHAKHAGKGSRRLRGLSSVNIATGACVASDGIEQFFQSVSGRFTGFKDLGRHGVPSRSSRSAKPWFDHVWFCNMLPSSVQGFDFSAMQDGQTVNTFPGIYEETNDKINFCLHVRNAFPQSLHEFFMPCFLLGDENDRSAIRSLLSQASELRFLAKPATGSGGRGLQLLDAHSLLRPCATGHCAPNTAPFPYAQLYLPNPMLIDGHKFDLRVYALVTDFEPVTKIWLHLDGFARLSTVPYSNPAAANKTGVLSYVGDLAPHVTNVHYQRNLPGYREPRSRHGRRDRCSSSTRGLECIWDQFESFDAAWEDLKYAVGRTLLSARAPITSRGSCRSCYQIFGVDVLVRENGEFFVVEVNSSPSIEKSNPLADGNVLAQVYRDTWRMVGVSQATPAQRVGGWRGRKQTFLPALEAVRLGLARIGKGLDEDWEEQELARLVGEWCRRGGFELATPGRAFATDPEAQAVMGDGEARVSEAFLGLVEEEQAEELCEAWTGIW